jgi:hypothetical protein
MGRFKETGNLRLPNVNFTPGLASDHLPFAPSQRMLAGRRESAAG